MSQPPARSALFLAFVLCDPRLHQFLNKRSRQWLVRGEVDGPFGCGEALEFILERFDNRGSGEQTAVVRKRGEPHQHSFVLERRHPIADGLGSLRWHDGPNRRAYLVQGAAGGFRDASEVFIDVFRSAVAFRRRTAIARVQFFHAGDATRTSTSSPCPRQQEKMSTAYTKDARQLVDAIFPWAFTPNTFGLSSSTWA